ncbi:hypothetical protein N7499_002886 [Penicillium canescens]|uniref:Uncharacterized protein n=1 Tax=Penicillium canescens TaxID=5083 RepID=A0AAD6HYI5_PENCN|nr:uncharacterized protein N7446_014150 [Penicillium canescens]KAJ6022350.1 hypothetical protein N7460_014094 [Penicillium canescens]KAJ6038998.1 hypothetical protein N7446_014150 [Penicillium canescens]KAJ6094290.1 hypothetical protein N7499_002886 [Penicillium canescens]KAJ6174673.1 hypothetical protein N7485_005410 [Penicillium canescens]
MTRLLSSGSPEPKNTGSPPTSIVGSEDDDWYPQTDGSDDDGKATFLDECSDGEETQGQRAKERVKERPLGGVRSVKSLNPEYLTESMERMIECMTELDVRVQSNADSLTGQVLWNQKMQRKFGAMDTLRKEVAALRKQVEVLSSRDAVIDRETVGSKRQKQ